MNQQQSPTVVVAGGDPISSALNTVTAMLATADQLGQLIVRLQDTQRTLAQAEADADAQSARLDPPQ